jgi:hypothetical protein
MSVSVKGLFFSNNGYENPPYHINMQTESQHTDRLESVNHKVI